MLRGFYLLTLLLNMNDLKLSLLFFIPESSMRPLRVSVELSTSLIVTACMLREVSFFQFVCVCIVFNNACVSSIKKKVLLVNE